ncbi:MAG: hypothetical protein SVU32_04415 [Candidatus Nanohaloarchaea archaeon]|nr:hypothetical protein [Candidatus Nanohaloarchaea archaeon]
MTEFKTIRRKQIELEGRNFLEAARKKAVDDDGSENEFVSLSKGFYTEDNRPVYQTNLTVPDDGEKIDEIAEKLKDMVED